MHMENWILAMIPPLLVWCGLFLYLQKVDKRVREVEAKLQVREGTGSPYPR